MEVRPILSIPLVEESETLDLKNATIRFRTRSESRFPDVDVGLIHGRMKSDEKENVMRAFNENVNSRSWFQPP
jgi:ATP-dependent DNA helicase RecG